MLPQVHPSSRRNRHRRHLLAAVVVAGAALLVIPGALPHAPGASPAGPANAARGLEPTATAALAAVAVPPTGQPAASPPASPAPIPSPATSPDPRPTPDPRGLADPADPSVVVGSWAAAPPVGNLTGYAWPIAHPRLTLPFGPTPWGGWVVDGQPFHDGVDLATFCGDRVTAAHDGVVLAAGRKFDQLLGWVGDLGPYFHRLDVKHIWFELPIMVVVDDGNGYRSMYAHFGRIVVHEGQRVRAGQLLGYEGMTGHATGCHLHYGLFSPWEHATFAIQPGVAKRMRLPTLEIARIDPLLVLPPKRGINEPGATSP